MAEEERIEEFTPSYRTRLGVGQGKKYVSFLADTLKPYIDRHFRTKPERANTGIGGSSMGGLISIYAGLRYPGIYSKLMIFSPSLLGGSKYSFSRHSNLRMLNIQKFIYTEEVQKVPMLYQIFRKLKAALEAQGQSREMQFELAIDPIGEHNEKRWGEEFPRAIEWLFFIDVIWFQG